MSTVDHDSVAPSAPVSAPRELVRVQREGEFARLTMNVPKRRNALSVEHMRQLLDAVRHVGASDARGLLLAGEGPVFCAGHDFADMVDADLAAMRDLLALCAELMTALQSIPQPVLARVHGLATAAGCQLVATADLAVASEDATFAIPGGQGGWFCHPPLVAFARAVPLKRALEMAFTGDVIDARTAEAWGLVNAVVPAAELDAACVDLLRRATRGSRTSKGMGKQGFYAQVDLDQAKAYAYAIELMAASSQTPDARERMAAVLEKSPRRLDWRAPRRRARSAQQEALGVQPGDLAAVVLAEAERVEPLGAVGDVLERVVDREHHAVGAHLREDAQQRRRVVVAADRDVEVLAQHLRREALQRDVGAALQALLQPIGLERQALPQVPEDHGQLGEAVEEAADDEPQRVGGGLDSERPRRTEQLGAAAVDLALGLQRVSRVQVERNAERLQRFPEPPVALVVVVGAAVGVAVDQDALEA